MTTDNTTRALFYALSVNITITGAKTVLGVITGSAALLAEAAHSLVDSLTEPILLIGHWHTRWWTKARYFWGLVAAVNMLFTGGVFAAWEGLRAVVSPGVESGGLWLGLVVLVGSAALEATSLVRAVRALAVERQGVPWMEFFRVTTNTALTTLVVEDSLDILGCLLAVVGIVLRLVTGSVVWDGLASLLIGLLLTVMAYQLGARNVRLLTDPVAV